MYFPVYEKQMEFLDAPEFVKGFIAGQGSGKTKIGAWDMLRRIRPGRTYAVVTPTYPMLRDATFRTFCEVAEVSGQWQPGAFNRTEFVARVLTQTNPVGTAEVLFRSAHDPDRLRGPNLSGVWMDEASLLAHQAYQICIARLREANEQGWLTATMTPKGMSHWTYEVFGVERPGVKLVRASTKDNPFIDKGFVERVYLEYGGLRARQELDGEFVNVEGAEWPAEYFAGDERLALENGANGIWFRDWPPALAVKVIALDPSKGKDAKHGDYRAIVLVGLDRQGRLWVDADLEREPTPMIVESLFRHNAAFRPQALGIETNQFQELLAAEVVRVSKERGAALPVVGIPNYVPKPVRIRTVGPYLARREVFFKAGGNGAGLLVGQLRDFPQGEFDDGPDALEMGIRLIKWLLGEGGWKPEQVGG